MQSKSLAVILVLFLSAIAGCASSFKVISGREKLVRIPQIVAHLEPMLERDKLLVLGKLVLQNPTESDLILSGINLKLQDESGNVIEQINTDWQRDLIKSREFIQAPVRVSLPIEILNRDVIQITLSTNLTYKKLNIRIPIKSKIAVIHLKAFKNSLSGPLEMVVYSKLSSDIFGSAALDYRLEIANPFNVDLQLEDVLLKIFTKQNPDIAKTHLAKTLLISKKSSQINGSIKLQKTFSALIIREFIAGRAIRAQLSGRLRVPKTDISVPFSLESVQEIDFSLFK